MKIICVGKNYEEHVKEMQSSIPNEPVIFIKPDSALLLKNQPFYYPDFSNLIHYELEVVVKINRIGKNIQERFAKNYYNEVGLGIDFTARDLQQKAKEKGNPWTLSKGFDQSAALGMFVPLESLSENINNISFSLLKNEQIVQKGNTSEMLFSVDKLIAYISTYMTLKIGDCIFTGTPAGVGAVSIGDCLKGYIEDKQLISCCVK